jgi:hypothetical protein
VTAPAYLFVVALSNRINALGNSYDRAAFLHFHDAAVLRVEDQWILDAISTGRMPCASEAIDERAAMHRDQAARQRRLALSSSRSAHIAAVREAQVFDAVARECMGLAAYLRALEVAAVVNSAPMVGDLARPSNPHDPDAPHCPWNRPEKGHRMPTPCTCSNSTDEALASAFGRKRDGRTL